MQIFVKLKTELVLNSVQCNRTRIRWFAAPGRRQTQWKCWI